MLLISLTHKAKWLAAPSALCEGIRPPRHVPRVANGCALVKGAVPKMVVFLLFSPKKANQNGGTLQNTQPSGAGSHPLSGTHLLALLPLETSAADVALLPGGGRQRRRTSRNGPGCLALVVAKAERDSCNLLNVVVVFFARFEESTELCLSNSGFRKPVHGICKAGAKDIWEGMREGWASCAMTVND